MANPAIGYVTSGNLNSGTFTVSGISKSFYENFVDGLTSVDSPTAGVKWSLGGNVDIKAESADGAYDAQDSRQTLNRYVKKLNADLDVKLIVAVGGLVSAFAATKHSTKPFLAIFGQVPATDDFELPDPTSGTPTFCGGINLNTPAANFERNQKVVDKLKAGSPMASPVVAADPNAKAADVCLIFNDNARMAKAERNTWISHGWKALAGGSNDGDNDEDDFARVLKKAKNKRSAKGIVVSSDPFFQHKQADFTTEAAKATYNNIVFCYPSKYFNGKTGRDIYHGPDMWEQYKLLGIKAGQLLTEITRVGGGQKFMNLDVAAMTSGNF